MESSSALGHHLVLTVAMGPPENRRRRKRGPGSFDSAVDPSRHIKRLARSSQARDMGFRDFLKSAAAIFRLSHKSDREEYMLYLKLVSLGIAVVGVIGFIIKLVGNLFFG